MIQFAAVAVLLLLIIVTKFTGNRASFAPVAPWEEEADRIEINAPGKDPIVAVKKLMDGLLETKNTLQTRERSPA